MRPREEALAREHLRRSETVFLAAVVALVFGVLSAYRTIDLMLGLLGGSLARTTLSSWVIWGFCLVGFAASTWVVSTLARNAPLPKG